ncbi:hypothetical protein FIV31_06430 [Coxiella endosymbiont of Ornithodoros amblus]|uniref:hypothetical protein n=1 Tax=Coxiella endosymbiont of Ornithodoros amblus TaxID=1656166 RepID=UPI00244DC122|nr:hypothetical protein [Coxiella endosymbiont of Ornithodoros amblus]MBW5802957.1 hypothetical protein [Coxiella endosymbiont of Ornithodoros amblus]
MRSFLLFKPDFHRVTALIALLALGRAFFSLNITMEIIIMFGAYLPFLLLLFTSFASTISFN